LSTGSAGALLEILTTKDGAYILREATPNLRPVWLVVKSLEDVGGYRLQRDDLVRLGLTLLRVKSASGLLDVMGIAAERLGKGPDHEESGEKIACRICLCDEEDEENPLIRPCSCSGTMQSIHLICLRTWLHNRQTTRKTGRVVSYFWEMFVCELCKTPFPTCVTANDREYSLPEITQHDGPCLMLEDFSYCDLPSKGLHVLSILSQSKCILVSARQGRNHFSDIKLDDGSVSREHAAIQRIGEDYWLHDLSSKFGTLVLARRPIRIAADTRLSLLVGNTVIHLQVMNKQSSCKDYLRRLCCRPQTAPDVFIKYVKEDDLKSFRWADESALEELVDASVRFREVQSLRGLDFERDQLGLRSRSEML
jgi:hypothetical protein